MRRLPRRGSRLTAPLTLVLALASSGCAVFGGGSPQLNEYGNPRKLKPRRTTVAISDADLRTRLYIFADDSMMGRQHGREGNRKATDYIARELMRLGVLPAGESGTWFQPVDGTASGTASGRNVIGVIRGGDSTLAGQYVAIGARVDHLGVDAVPVDRDSAHARRDSVFNGADDGSGAMALLEIAEAIALAPVKPRRSILFVWHTGEEGGLTGSRWFVQHPTVPRDSIVAMINMDMIGRGRATDLPGGGDDYLAVVGSRRLSTELGEAVVAVNLTQPRPLRLDYRFDEPTTWPGYNNIYGRSDHANYARCNIPIAFFFTGLHQDYHRVTDEPQYIDYPHYAMITRYIGDLVLHLANRPARPTVDTPGPGC